MGKLALTYFCLLGPLPYVERHCSVICELIIKVSFDELHFFSTKSHLCSVMLSVIHRVTFACTICNKSEWRKFVGVACPLTYSPHML